MSGGRKQAGVPCDCPAQSAELPGFSEWGSRQRVGGPHEIRKLR